MVNNLLATQETWVLSQAWEDSLEKEMVTHSSGESHGQRSLVEAVVHGVANRWTWLKD